MAWWAGRRSGQGGYGTHQEKKEGSKHKRPEDRKRALEDATDDWPRTCADESLRGEADWGD